MTNIEEIVKRIKMEKETPFIDATEIVETEIDEENQNDEA